MIYSVNYNDLSAQINVWDFARYLKSTGWIEIKRKNPYIKPFQLKNSLGFFQITLPVDKSLSDYKYAMYSSVETLAKAEGKPIEKVLLYLLNPNTDIVKIRYDSYNVEPGNIMLDDAIKLFDNAKRLIAATALDVLQPKKYHIGRSEEAVQKFISSCKFGQTEIGSYIVSVVCPFAEINNDEEYQQLSLFSEEEQCANSFTRKVTTKFFENVETIKAKIDSGSFMDLVTHFDEYKISANFLEALNGINGNSGDDKVEFYAEWSPVVRQRIHFSSSVVFTREYNLPIKSTINALKETCEKREEIVGRVSRLMSEPIPEKRQGGQATISYISLNNRSQSVTAELGNSDYDKAISAHQLGKYVRIVGTIVKHGNRSTIICDDFDIID